MIIFGTRGIKSTMDQGDFNCPQCEAIRPYKHKKVTNFFTLYFIPIIPLGRVGDYVECQSCKCTFVERVLDYGKQNQDSDAFLSEYEKAINHCMVMMMLADGQIDEQEMLTVQTIINKYSHNDITLDELEEFTRIVQEKNEDISTYLSKVTPSLNEHGKEIIIKCAIAVAGSDGHIDDSEIKLINEMAQIMQMSSSHLKGIFADIQQNAKPSFSNN